MYPPGEGATVRHDDQSRVPHAVIRRRVATKWASKSTRRTNPHGARSRNHQPMCRILHQIAQSLVGLLTTQIYRQSFGRIRARYVSTIACIDLRIRSKSGALEQLFMLYLVNKSDEPLLSSSSTILVRLRNDLWTVLGIQGTRLRQDFGT
jgi:hypothetical protein